jgi:hypothetical protein
VEFRGDLIAGEKILGRRLGCSFRRRLPVRIQESDNLIGLICEVFPRQAGAVRIRVTAAEILSESLPRFILSHLKGLL